MKKSWKRILGLVLAASLTVGGSVMAFADEAEEFNPESFLEDHLTIKKI